MLNNWKRALAAATILTASTVALSGCEIIPNESGYRGGQLAKFSDDNLIQADTKNMRVLRATIIMATLAQIGGNSVKDEAAAEALLKQLARTGYHLGKAWEVASSGPPDYQSAGSYDPTFDDRFVPVVDDLFRLAALSLSRHELKNLLNNVESSNYLGALMSLWGVVNEFVDVARRGFAGYRDSLDAAGAIVGRQDPAVQKAHAGGDGAMETYSATLDAFYAKIDHAKVKPEIGDFGPWFLLTREACDKSLWKSIPVTAFSLGGSTVPVPAGKGACAAAEIGFAKGREVYKGSSVDLGPGSGGRGLKWTTKQ